MGISFTLGQLAEALGATLEGDRHRIVSGVASLEQAGARPGSDRELDRKKTALLRQLEELRG